MSNCKKLPYFEGLTDETIKQGSDFDPTEGVKAYDGYDEEIEYTYSPQELDTCLVGSQVIQYRASQTSEGNMLPNICIPDGLALALPSICDDYESTTAERIIRIIKANDPTIYGIPQVTVARGTAFDVLDGVTAVDDNGNPITDITYSGTLDKEVSGDIVSITDGQSVVPVKSLEVALEPIQDLNGQDAPYPAGGGKNLFNPQKFIDAGATYTNGKYEATQTIIQSISLSDITFKDDTQYYFYVHGAINSPSSSGSMRVKLTYTDSTTSYISILAGEGERDLDGYSTSGKTIQSAEFSAYGTLGTYTNWISEFMFCEASNGTDYAPYSNICPISGHTQIETIRTGKNLFDGVWESGSIGNNGQEQTNTSNIRTKMVAVKGGQTYCFSWATQSLYILIFAYKADGTFSRYIRAITSSGSTVTMNADEGYLRWFTYNNTVEPTNFQLELGSTATSYEPYQGDTYTTSLGQTVYGGTLDVVSGELVVDRAIKAFDGNENWRRWQDCVGGSWFVYDLATSERADTTNFTDNISSHFVSINPNQASTNSPTGCVAVSAGWIGISTEHATVDAMKTWLAEQNTASTAVQVSYLLATPQTIQLTPQQVMLLHGNNNVWSDGEVTMVYSVDIPTDGSVTYPLEGEYEITYSAEDRCGNIGEAIRHITVQ